MSAGPRVFVVEDEALIAMELAHRITELGYRVCGQARRGEQAITRIPSAAPDVVLLDINLGAGMDGFAVAEQLPLALRSRIVFLSAYASGEVAARARAMGASGMLAKPFHLEALRAALASVARPHESP